MVNEKKLQILNRLKGSQLWLSGEQISGDLGISRVAVWKQIQALIDQGYPIQSSSKGYRIMGGGDTLSELEFGTDEGILFYRELSSTMDEALRQHYSQKSNAESYLVLADRQLEGVTRNNRVWDSPSGGIYLTFVLNKSMGLEEVPLMKKRGILTMLTCLESFGITGLEYNLKGEIYLGSQKATGLLEEYHVRGDTIQWFSLGLGLHINDRPGHTDGMTSVFLYTGETLDRVLVVKKLKECWERSLGMKSPQIEKALGFFTIVP